MCKPKINNAQVNVAPSTNYIIRLTCYIERAYIFDETGLTKYDYQAKLWAEVFELLLTGSGLWPKW